MRRLAGFVATLVVSFSVLLLPVGSASAHLSFAEH